MKKLVVCLVVAVAFVALTTAAFSDSTMLPHRRGTEDKKAPEPKTIAARIKGKVVSRDGKPIANAQVCVRWRTRAEKKLAVRTDKAGRFLCTADLAEQLAYAQIIASANGYAIGRGFYRYPQGQNDELTITLWPGYKLKGTVVDEKGKPVEGAQVQLERYYGYSNGPGADGGLPEPYNRVTTGKNGAFTFDGVLNPNDFSYVDAYLSVSAKGRALIHNQFQKQALASPVKILDPRECILEGVLYLPGKTGPAPEGTPMTVVVATNCSCDNGCGGGCSCGCGSEQRGATVDKNGKFRIAQLPPGMAGIVLSGQDYHYGEDAAPEPRPWALPAMTDVSLKSTQTKSVELVMAAGALIKGTVIDKASGKPIAHARLTINHPGEPESINTDMTISDAKGQFQARVAAGEVALGVTSIEDRQNQVWFQTDERPEMSLTAADGEVKPDVVFTIDPSQSNQGNYESQKPAPADFELKPGTFNLTWNPDIDCSEGMYPNQSRANASSSHVKKMPKLVSNRAEQAVFTFDGSGDDGALFVILDESKGTGKGWDTAYVDMNRNGDLTDDQPIKFRMRPGYNQVRTGWFTVQAHQGAVGGERTDRPVQVRLSIYSYSDQVRVEALRKGAWEGTIDSNKGKVECVAIDTDGNGQCGDVATINDKLEPQNRGDRVFIDTNGCGKVSTQPWGPHAVDLYKLTRVVDKFYQIKVSGLGDKITIEPYAGPMGQLLVRAENVEGLSGSAASMYLISKSGVYQIQKPGGEPVSLPADAYKVESCDMTLGSGDKKLSLSCSPNSTINVSAEQQAKVVIGGKLALAISPDQKDLVFKGGNTEVFNWDIRIGGKTVVSSIGDRNGQDAPKVEFYDKKGTLLSTAKAGST